MKKLIIVLLILPLISFSQNLIYNGDFEKYSSLPTDNGQLMNCLGWNNVNLVPGYFFSNESVKGSPDYFHRLSVSKSVGLPNSSIAYVKPYSGDAIVGFCTYGTTTPPGFPVNSFWFMDNYREYMSSKLNSPLKLGVKYKLSFYISSGESNHIYGASSDRIGIYFSKEKLIQDSAEVINVIPQLEILNEIWNTSWQKYSFEFIPNKEFEFITIGNFYNDNQTSTSVVMSNPPVLPWSYYFIDNIELYEIDQTSLDIIEVNSNNKKLLKVTDLFGRETNPKNNEVLLYIYNNGTVEKRIIIE